MSLNSSSSGGTPTATGSPMVGYRFHPTDRELIVYYLGPKIRRQDDRDPVIADVEVCKFEPWDLPVWSRIKSNDRVWYFFCPRQHKFKKSTRSNRTTKEGYWKPDGKVRLIRAKRTKEVIGTKRTLVFHLGRYKKGTRTKWIMHEYECTSNSRLSNQGDFVICKLMKSDEKDTKRDAYHPTTLNPEVEGQELLQMANISSHDMCEPIHLMCSGSYNKNQDLCINEFVRELVDANSVESSPMVDSNMGWSLSVTNCLRTSSQQSSQTPKTTLQTSNIQNFDSLPAINTSPSYYRNNVITKVTSFDPEIQANANSKTYSKVLGSCHDDASAGCSFVFASESASMSGTMVDSTPDISKTDSLAVFDSENENLNDHNAYHQYENSDILVPDCQLAFDLESKYEELEGNSEFSAELWPLWMFEPDHMVKSPLWMPTHSDESPSSLLFRLGCDSTIWPSPLCL